MLNSSANEQPNLEINYYWTTQSGGGGRLRYFLDQKQVEIPSIAFYKIFRVYTGGVASKESRKH